jgi:leader peptidase (prepilin peptidase)/N-methyltransferase
MLQREIVSQILPQFSAFVFVLGTVVGSFLNVVVWRLPRGESLSHPGSHCPTCGHAIRPWENIPILSWLALGRRCSQCRLPISRRYPLVELATGLLFLLLWWRLWQSSMPLAALWGYLFLGSALLAASLIDIEHFLIPDEITFTGMGVAALLAIVFPETHLGTGLTGLPGGEQLVTATALEAIGPAVGRTLAANPRAAALLDAALGMLVGYAMLRLLLEAGQRLWGRVRGRSREPLGARLSAAGISIGDDELEAAWEDLLVRPKDEFRCQAVKLSAPGWEAPADATPVTVRVTGSRVFVGSSERALADVEVMTMELVSWEYPREVMGHGDPKLLALIGAFLGPDATVFVLMWGAYLGCGYGIARIALCWALRHELPRRAGLFWALWRQPLPFGPFLAVGALGWTLFGEALVRWYGALLAGRAG